MINLCSSYLFKRKGEIYFLHLLCRPLIQNKKIKDKSGWDQRDVNKRKLVGPQQLA